MKRLIPTLCYFITTTTIWGSKTEYSFNFGETLKYKVHYGLFVGGNVIMKVHEPVLKKNKKCYKITVSGRTTGLLCKILDIRNYFCSYLEEDTLKTVVFARKVIENDYRKIDEATFDYNNNKVTVIEYFDNKPPSRQSFDIPNNVQDVISKWYIYRNCDFKKMQVGHIVDSKVFFDNTIYQHFAAKYVGKQVIDTDLGKIRTLVIEPKIPFGSDGKETVFDGDDSVRLYLSDDDNKIPIKIKIKLFVGAIEIDIIDCQHLKSPLAKV